MHDLDLIMTLAGGLAAALAFGYVTQRLGLSPIVGYLLAGIAVGPATPGFVADRAMAEQLAELGIILLMFGVGLQFHFEELLAVRRIAIPGAVVQSLAATVLGAVVIHWLGWGWTAGVVYGLAISVASTVVLVRVLSDSGDLHTPTGHIAVGWLVMEDLFTVVILVLLPLVFGSQASSPGGVAVELLLALLKIAALVAFTFLVGGPCHPVAAGACGSDRLAGSCSTLTILVVALGIAVGSAMVFGVSMALGAFLAGMVVGRSDFSLRAASEALPTADAFAVLFFVSVGMLFEPVALFEVTRHRRAHAGRRHRRQAAGRLRDHLGVGLPQPGRARGRGRPRPDRGVFVHPGCAGEGIGHPACCRDQWTGGRGESYPSP